MLPIIRKTSRRSSYKMSQITRFLHQTNVMAAVAQAVGDVRVVGRPNVTFTIRVWAVTGIMTRLVELFWSGRLRQCMPIAISNLIDSLVFSVLALLFGFFGLALVFSDLGPGESWVVRILVATLFFLISGALIGFLNPNLWMISGLTAWGGLLIGGFITWGAIRRYDRGDAASAQEPTNISAGLIMLFLPLTLSLIGGYIGGYIGKRLRQRRTNIP